MIVNRDSKRAHPVRIVFRKGGAEMALGAGGRVAVAQYSTRQYRYLNAGEESRPVKNQPPVRFGAKGGQTLVLPATSMTIVKGSGPGV
jgi:hypothetical protein